MEYVYIVFVLLISNKTFEKNVIGICVLHCMHIFVLNDRI